MRLDSTHICYSPLTETVYIATDKEDSKGRFYASSKVDRTNEFLAAVLAWCGDGYSRDIILPDGSVIEVSMTKRDAA